jgi:hypothetical protein
MPENSHTISALERIRPLSEVERFSELRALSQLFREMSDKAQTVSDDPKVKVGDPIFSSYQRGIAHAWSLAAEIMHRQSDPTVKSKPSDYHIEIREPILAIIESFGRVAAAKADKNPREETEVPDYLANPA